MDNLEPMRQKFDLGCPGDGVGMVQADNLEPLNGELDLGCHRDGAGMIQADNLEPVCPRDGAGLVQADNLEPEPYCECLFNESQTCKRILSLGIELEHIMREKETIKHSIYCRLSQSWHHRVRTGYHSK